MGFNEIGNCCLKSCCVSASEIVGAVALRGSAGELTGEGTGESWRPPHQSGTKNNPTANANKPNANSTQYLSFDLDAEPLLSGKRFDGLGLSLLDDGLSGSESESDVPFSEDE